MINNKKILCTICSRSGSKGLKNKALKKIGKLNLLEITINQAIKSKLFDYVILSSDSQKYLKFGQKKNIDQLLLRKKSLSGDKVSKLDVIKNTLLEAEKRSNSIFDIIVDLDITTPLREIKDIKKSFSKFIQGDYSNLMSCCIAKKNPYFNMIELKKNLKLDIVVNKKKYVRRQDIPEVYIVNAAIYIWKRSTLLKTTNLFNKKTGVYLMPFYRSFDIDNLDDYLFIKKIYGR